MHDRDADRTAPSRRSPRPSAGPPTTTTRCRWSSPTADGAWVTDVDGRRYLDCLAGYSALNFGHRHPALIAAAHAQLDRVTLTSRAFLHDQFGAVLPRGWPSCAAWTLVLPMNTGAEAVETAIKVARKWGYKVKGVPDGQAPSWSPPDNFHGRTTTIISFSTDPDARADFGPYTPGFRIVARTATSTRCAPPSTTTTVAVLHRADPGRGRGARAAGGLPARRSGGLCTGRNVLFIADEIQSGLGRTGDTFACDHEGVVPDMYVLGKALGGGVVPVSAVVADADVLGVLRPGEHGSTFGGNPLACAVGIAVVDLLRPASSRSAPGAGRACCTGGSRAGRPRAHAVRGRGPVGRRRHRPGADDRPRRRASGCWPPACWPRTPTARRSAWPRRWWSRPTSSTSPSTRWPRSSPTCADLPPAVHERISRVHDRRSRVHERRSRVHERRSRVHERRTRVPRARVLRSCT